MQKASTYVLARAANGAYGQNSNDVRDFVKGREVYFDSLVTLDEAKRFERVKPMYRLAQACAFAAHGVVGAPRKRNADGSPRAWDSVSALVTAAVALAPLGRSFTFTDLHHLVGKSTEGASALPGVSKARLNKFLGLVTNAGTVESKVSRTVGISGYLTMLGIVESTGKRTFKVVNRDHVFLRMYCARLDGLTDGQLALIGDEMITEGLRS